MSNVSIPSSRRSVNGSCGGLRSFGAPSGPRRTVILPEAIKAGFLAMVRTQAEGKQVQ